MSIDKKWIEWVVVYLRLFPKVITTAPATMPTAIIAPITSYTNREGGGETDDGDGGAETIPLGEYFQDSVGSPLFRPYTFSIMV